MTREKIETFSQFREDMITTFKYVKVIVKRKGILFSMPTVGRTKSHMLKLQQERFRSDIRSFNCKAS